MWKAPALDAIKAEYARDLRLHGYVGMASLVPRIAAPKADAPEQDHVMTRWTFFGKHCFVLYATM